MSWHELEPKEVARLKDYIDGDYDGTLRGLAQGVVNKAARFIPITDDDLPNGFKVEEIADPL